MTVSMALDAILKFREANPTVSRIRVTVSEAAAKELCDGIGPLMQQAGQCQFGRDALHAQEWYYGTTLDGSETVTGDDIRIEALP